MGRHMGHRHFKLVFRIEWPSADVDALKSLVDAALIKERDGLGIKIVAVDAVTAELRLVGDRENIDSAHSKLEKDIFATYPSLRILDELGEELRIEAFKILAKLEPRFRAFISEAMTEALGFSWWERIGNPGMKARVATVRKKHVRRDVSQHPIEFTEFEHLVEIITDELAHWTSEKQLTVSDLAQLLNSAGDLEALKIEINRRTKRECLWDTVFAKLFVDEKAWNDAKEELLKTVIPSRHKVSHHRPFRLYELDQLATAAQRVHVALKAKARPVSPDEQRELHDQAKTLLDRARERSASRSASALFALQNRSHPSEAASLQTLWEMGRFGSIPEVARYLREITDARESVQELYDKLQTSGPTSDLLAKTFELAQRQQSVHELYNEFQTSGPTSDLLHRTLELVRKQQSVQGLLEKLQAAAQTSGNIEQAQRFNEKQTPDREI